VQWASIATSLDEYDDDHEDEQDDEKTDAPSAVAPDVGHGELEGRR
jgi:hypothetical protein